MTDFSQLEQATTMYTEPIVEEPTHDVNSKFIVPNVQKLYQYDENNFQTQVSLFYLSLHHNS